MSNRRLGFMCSRRLLLVALLCLVVVASSKKDDKRKAKKAQPAKQETLGAQLSRRRLQVSVPNQPLVVDALTCRYSSAHLDRLPADSPADSPADCEVLPPVFASRTLVNGPTRDGATRAGRLEAATSAALCDGALTGRFNLTLDDGVAHVRVRPQPGFTMHSIGLVTTDDDPTDADDVAWRGLTQTYPRGGTTDTEALDFACTSDANAMASSPNKWSLVAVLCSEGQGQTRPPAVPETHCRPSWGVVTAVPSQCFRDPAVFPTTGVSCGPHPHDGTFEGVMMQFAHDDNCTTPTVTGTLSVLVEGGVAQFFVTPNAGRLTYALQLHASRDGVTNDTATYTTKHTTFNAGRHQMQRIGYGQAATHRFWKLSGVICDPADVFIKIKKEELLFE
eukprot:Selendium_serpulae@DN4800_c0_g1_i1.p1